jgi:trypsin-like peptidase
VFKAARSAIVEIVTQDKSGSPLLTGTGFFISNDGTLVTNRHLVEVPRRSLQRLNRATFFVCKGVLAEPKDADIAILKFEANNVLYLTLATDPHLFPGQNIESGPRTAEQAGASVKHDCQVGAESYLCNPRFGPSTGADGRTFTRSSGSPD